MTASERRLAIMEVLSLRKKETCENLAFELGVSIRTIYYDLDALTPYYPIQTQSGKGGGVYVEDGFRWDRKYLTDEQSETLEEIMPLLSSRQAAVIRSILDTFKLQRRKRA